MSVKDGIESLLEKESFACFTAFSCVIGFVAFALAIAFSLKINPEIPGFFLFGQEVSWQMLLLSGFLGMEIIYWLCPKELLEHDKSSTKIEFVLVVKLVCFCVFCGLFLWILVSSLISQFFESFLMFAGCVVAVIIWYLINASRVTVMKEAKK